MQKTIPYSQTRDIHCELASRDLWHYCKIKSPDFYTDNAPYLQEVCEAIQDFENDDMELLIVNMPPRHGKSRTAVNAVQWLLGKNPKYKIMTCSYNEKLSRKFSKQTRNAIQEQPRTNRIAFCDVFGGVKIKYGSASVDMWTLDGNDEENYLATSPTATTTGIGADFIVIDDIVKSKYEACNQTILENHWEWFTDTLYSRLEGKRKLLVFMTRWATKDLAGRLIELFDRQGRKIRVITKKACDNGIMLNDNILNYEQYLNLIDTIGEDTVRANFDQEPIDLKGKLYGEFITYKNQPVFDRIESMCDTADKGTDYLCNIIYGVVVGSPSKAYVLDVYYTQDGMDITEKEISRRLMQYKVNNAILESNFGGTAFKKVIERIARDSGNTITRFITFVQTKNKEARILSNSTNVIRQVYMPDHWDKLFPTFYKALTEYQRGGNNLNDDAPDTVTMIAERMSIQRKSLV